MKSALRTYVIFIGIDVLSDVKTTHYKLLFWLIEVAQNHILPSDWNLILPLFMTMPNR